VLYRSTPAMQQWFQAKRCQCVIAGSPYPGVKIPSIDVDFAAGCRHAAGRFVALGHHRLAMVRPDPQLAGDLESVVGFEAGAGGAVPSLLHDGTPRGICTSLERCFARAQRPTGLFVFHTAHALTVLSWLQKEGVRVPREVSVVCRDDDAFLDFAVPKLARYAPNVSLFARKLFRLIEGLISGGAPRVLRQHLIPDVVRGETLARAAI
jgi:DNA-binding LacI/PurR family transcriptional regulator